MFLTRAAVRNPILVLMVCIATVVLSQIALTRLPVDLFPNITVPAITVSTSYSGASPEDVERTVTYPIEQAMTRVAGVQQLNSTSRRGSSMVQVWFDWGADLNVAEVEIIQNIQRIARSLPDGVSQPAVLKFDISNIPVAQVVVAAPGMDARVLYQLATDTIEPQLERLPGVSQAFVSGGLVRQFNVNVDPHRMAATGLSLQDVDAAVRRYNALIPSGSLRNADIDFQLMVPTTLQDVAAIRRVVLTSRKGVPVYIADIAAVEDGAADQTQIVKVDGEPGITVSVARQPGANIVEVGDALRAARPGISVPQAVLDATQEVGTAVFASTATTIAVFFPVVFLTGVARRLFVPMALTIVFAMAASYLVSMTIDPVLSMRFLRARRPDDADEEPGTRAGGAMARVERSSSRLLDRLDAGYQRLLELALQRRRWVLGTITVLFVLSMEIGRA